jgi:acylphosphatase
MTEAEGVAGWCRNLPDGRVEACFEGERAAVERAVAWCRVGPASAIVTSVDVTTEMPQGERGFRLG